MEIIDIRKDKRNWMLSAEYQHQQITQWDPSYRNCFSKNTPCLNEVCRLQTIWSSPLYLYDYFKSKKNWLDGTYYNKIPIINAVDITLKSLTPFFDLLDTKDLDGLFKTLHNHPTNSSDNKYKHKIKESDNNKNWLRLYALKISRGTYIVTGGAIKLWKDMDMDVATRTELQKMQMVADYLKEESITDKDSLEAYVFENGLL